MARIMSILILLSSLTSIFTIALAKDGEVGMTFRGTLITPPLCKINDNSQIEVDFGKRVGVNKVDFTEYRQLINYQITCESKGNNDNWVLTLSLIGEPTDFDNKNALSTNKKNLGIQIYQDGKPFIPNSKLLINASNPPVLEAVPIKEIGTTLTEGYFFARATLRADYQ